MKHNGLKICVLVLCFFVLSNCNNRSGKKSMDTTDFKVFVQDWNNAHSSKDVGVFSNLYDNSVLFYGTMKEKNICIESKLSLFKKNPDFYQQIFGDIHTENTNETEVKCSFIKRVTINQLTTDYPSYLIFKKVGDSWKIIIEGDLVNDKNLSKSETVNNQEITNKDNEEIETLYWGSNVLTGKVIIKNLVDPRFTDGREFKNQVVLKLPHKVTFISTGQNEYEGEETTDEIQIYGDLTNYVDPKIKYKDLINREVTITANIVFAPSGNYPLLANIIEDFTYEIK